MFTCKKCGGEISLYETVRMVDGYSFHLKCGDNCEGINNTKECTAPNITYCRQVIGKIECDECKWFKGTMPDVEPLRVDVLIIERALNSMYNILKYEEFESSIWNDEREDVEKAKIEIEKIKAHFA